MFIDTGYWWILEIYGNMLSAKYLKYIGNQRGNFEILPPRNEYLWILDL